MNDWKRWLMVLWVGLLVIGCGGAAMPASEAPMAPSPNVEPGGAAMDGAQMPSPTMDSTPSDRAASPMPEGAVETKPSAPVAAPVQGKAGDGKDEPVQRPDARPLLVYEAEMAVRVEHGKIAEAIEAIIDIAEARGGYLISRNDQQVQVRVPSESLRDTLSEVGGQGDVLRRSVTAQDVSEQYHDLQVKLSSLEAVRARLEQFLTRAKDVTEAMMIAKQLDAVGQQIDQVKGRMKYLRTRAAYSLISVAVEQEPETVVVEPPPPPPTPAAKPARMPVPWLHEVGLDTLTRLPEQD